MNTNHALQFALRSLFLVALTAVAAACGAAPEGQNTVDDKVSTAPNSGAPASEDSDSDAAAAAPAPSTTSTTVTPTFGPVAPVENVGGAPHPGGIVPTRAPGMPHTQ